MIAYHTQDFNFNTTLTKIVYNIYLRSWDVTSVIIYTFDYRFQRKLKFYVLYVYTKIDFNIAGLRRCMKTEREEV